MKLLLLAGYFMASLMGYSGKSGAVAIILISVAFNEEVLVRGFLWVRPMACPQPGESCPCR